MTLNCFIVDDNSLHRFALLTLVDSHPNLNLVGHTSSLNEAKKALEAKNIDLVFLSVEMPIINGFDFWDTISNKPLVIFISLSKDNAAQAFDQNAIDYLSKPLTEKRLDQAVDKALQMYVVLHQREKQLPAFIYVKSNSKKSKVYLEEIKYIEALGDYVKIITKTGSFIVLSTMKGMENRLPQKQFMRIHKSYIVNLNLVDRYHGSQVEIDKVSIPLSRNKRNELDDSLSALIG